MTHTHLNTNVCKKKNHFFITQLTLKRNFIKVNLLLRFKIIYSIPQWVLIIYSLLLIIWAILKKKRKKKKLIFRTPTQLLPWMQWHMFTIPYEYVLLCHRIHCCLHYPEEEFQEAGSVISTGNTPHHHCLQAARILLGTSAVCTGFKFVSSGNRLSLNFNSIH